MSTITAPVEEHILLHNVSWETYERLLEDYQDQRGTHFYYDEGELEIMVTSARHESPKETLTALVFILAEELDIELESVGSMTFKRKALLKGFEPDHAFYVARAAEVRAEGVEDLTAEGAPLPDLIIEVDVTSPSLPRFPIYAAFGVREIWQHKKGRVFFHRLEHGDYMGDPLQPGVSRTYSRDRHAVRARP